MEVDIGEYSHFELKGTDTLKDAWKKLSSLQTIAIKRIEMLDSVLNRLKQDEGEE